MHFFPDPLSSMTISGILSYHQLAPRYPPFHANHPPITEDILRTQIVTPRKRLKLDDSDSTTMPGLPKTTRDQPELYFMPGLQAQLISLADITIACSAACSGSPAKFSFRQDDPSQMLRLPETTGDQ